MKLLILNLAIFLMASFSIHGSSRQEQWKKVDEALEKGLPKTAIELLEPIIKESLADKAYAEAVKAIARKISCEGNIQGNKPEERILRLEKEIAQAPKEIVSLMQTILASWYWDYFQQNRWRFMQRTSTTESPGKDFTTWDLRRLFAHIDKTYQQALAARDTLKKMPISEWDTLLEKGTVPDIYRPTVFDFIAQQALEFYCSGEQAGALPEDAYELSADSAIFEDASRFLEYTKTFAIKDFPDSPILKAQSLYGDLMMFHEKDADKTAFLDVDLSRLIYGNNIAVGEQKNKRFQAALERFIRNWGDHEIASMALYHLGKSYQAQGDWVKAHEWAVQGRRIHPESNGGKQCANLVMEIEARDLNILTEQVWNKPWPSISIHYRNLTNIHFRLVSYDWKKILNDRRARFDYPGDNERQQLLKEKPQMEWSNPLPPTKDYKQHTFETRISKDLAPGFYYLIASAEPHFGEQNNAVSITHIWVSDLSLVIRPRSGLLEGFVLNAISGEPLAEAEIRAWYEDQNGNRVAEPLTTTDATGFFSMKPAKNWGYWISARHGNQELMDSDSLWVPQTERIRARTQTFLFSDRMMYRPGQTVHYKGIVLNVDQEKDNYRTVARQRVKIVFYDPNNKECGTAEHVSNDYGSFSGSFTAPSGRVTGHYRIEFSGADRGSVMVQVEEYKRPKFQATLESPDKAPRLNDKVVVKGKAESYTGAVVDGASVKWRVVREVRWPMWWGWGRRPSSHSPSQEIAHGTAKTQSDGSFEIAFLAKPDPKAKEKDGPTFWFRIYADVTDTTGETRSADRSIHLGFAALQASLDVDEWQTVDKAVQLQISTTTLDDIPQIAEGSLKIYRLKEPNQVYRPSLFPPLPSGQSETEDAEESPLAGDMSDPNQWPLGEVLTTAGFTTGGDGKSSLSIKLGAGIYRAILETQDRFGKKVTVRTPLRILDPSSSKLTAKIPHLLEAPKWSHEPGEVFTAVWGTGYDTGRAFVEIEHRHKIVERFWTEPGCTQQQIKKRIPEDWRGGFTLHITQVRENRAYTSSRHIDVPWSQTKLNLEWESFTSKLLPGQKETWSLIIRPPLISGTKVSDESTIGANIQKLAAEMVATLYDSSLDAFLKLHWPNGFSCFYGDHSTAFYHFANRINYFQHILGNWHPNFLSIDQRYRDFPEDLVRTMIARRAFGAGGGRMMRGATVMMMDAAPMAEATAAFAPAPATAKLASSAKGMLEQNSVGYATMDKAGIGSVVEAQKATEQKLDLSQVSARKNLNETAFFFPHLLSDSNGVVRLTFTMPEALTTWRFLGFAHDTQCRSGFIEAKTITAKDLMVQPNAPRFVREGDWLEITVKVSNQSAARQQGKVKLTFRSALDDSSLDNKLGLQNAEQDFNIPSKESRSFGWRIRVPDGASTLIYKTVASTGKVSDGEEGYLPVLSKRIWLTESLPLPIRGPATRQFEFSKLLNSSPTALHQSLTVQMVSNPAWYAVLALPYLMGYPHECTEQTFNRLYANALARLLANSDPRIRRVFDLWKNTSELDSPLEKNQDLKSVMIEETPWLRQAQRESQARKNIGILFDINRLDSETTRITSQLGDAQLADGSWPWFPGGRGNDFITLYIVTGFGRLRHLGTDLPVQPAIKALTRLDTWMDQQYKEIKKTLRPEDYVPSSTLSLYLYGRSFFKERPISKNHEPALQFFLARAREHWLKNGSRQSQAHLALALKRWGGAENLESAKAIMKSIKERSVTQEEMGMFWRDTEYSWWWYQAPIETQALMIEAFDEVMGDATAVEECRVWLLKQKQTQDWKTTKATADAVYALLLRGRDLLASQELVEVQLGGVPVKPDVRKSGSNQENSAASDGVTAQAATPGTGYYEKRFTGSEIKGTMGHITVKKVDAGVAWGGVHWQYFEDMDKVAVHEDTPLKLNKRLFIKKYTSKGPVLEAVNGPQAVGDELVVRIELRVDRDMEYVHLKDQRGSGTEPVNVLSRWRYQDGLAYYESTRDTASHFFIEYLPKGTYVFEYSSRIQLRGEYQSGIASIQCMYAPEFNSHSQSYKLVVK